jgi:hypothetical protein
MIATLPSAKVPRNICDLATHSIRSSRWKWPWQIKEQPSTSLAQVIVKAANLTHNGKADKPSMQATISPAMTPVDILRSR